MRPLILSAAFALIATSSVAQDVPKMYSETYPEHALGEAMALEGALAGEKALLDAKTRELVSLGVAAQVPCQYCIYYHTKAARAAGATEAEIREAVAAAASVRQWSTVLNGMAYDLDAFKMEVDELMN